MSFVGAADCSAAANPLSRLQKHVHQDTSLQRDRLAARPSADPELATFRSPPAHAPPEEVCCHPSP